MTSWSLAGARAPLAARRLEMLVMRLIGGGRYAAVAEPL